MKTKEQREDGKPDQATLWPKIGLGAVAAACRYQSKEVDEEALRKMMLRAARIPVRRT